MKKIYFSAALITAFVFYSFHIVEKKSKAFDFDRSELPKESTQGNEDNPYAASQFRYEMLSIQGKNVDLLEARKKAIEYSKNELRNLSLNKSNAIDSWQAVGPGNIGGRIRSIIIDPANSSNILIGSVSGGIWKSTTGGASWSSKIENGNPLAIGSMVYAGGNTVYAGSGEGWGNSDAVYGGGIYKSTNFGDSWTLLTSTNANPENFRNVVAMNVDPSGNIYAATRSYNYKHGVGAYYTNGGLFKSANGGTSWTKISPIDAATNYFRPSDVIAISSTEILLATNVDTAPGGIFRTTDGGTTWNKITSGLPSSGYARIEMTQDIQNSSILYAAFQSTNNNTPDFGLKGIYKSINNGMDWIQITNPPAIASTGNRSYLGTQGWYDNTIAVDGNNIYVGGVDLMKTSNGGTAWSQLTYWHPYYGTPVVHADHHALVFDPNNPAIIFNGNDGGIYKTTNSGSSWDALNNGLEITQFYGGSIFPTGTIFSGGTQDNGHLQFTSGTSWDQTYGGDGGYAAQDQSNSDISYEEYVYLDISKTTNGGVNWNESISGLTDANNNSNSLFIAPFSLNPENSNVLIAGSNKVWITDDKAANWFQSSDVLITGQKVSAVTVVNSSADYLGFAGTTGGKIFKCTSLDPTAGLDTWTEITPAGNNNAYVRRIVVDQNDKNKLYACYSGFNNSNVGKHVYYSSNQGTSWADISSNLPDVPVHSLVIDPTNESILYIGTETGVYTSLDRGGSWSEFNSGMASYVPVDELVLQSGTSKLFAFTHGRSAWMNSTPLPVELTTFAAKIENGKVRLDWETATELNNFGFEVERSESNAQWKKLAFISGAVNSSSTKKYFYIDESNNYGKNLYRLKQIDNNGRFEYSKIVEITNSSLPNKYTLEQNYPNPFNPSTKIKYSVPGIAAKYSLPVQLKVYDVLGTEIASLVNEEKAPGNYEVDFNAAGISSGVYYYKLSGDNFSITKKMLILK